MSLSNRSDSFSNQAIFPFRRVILFLIIAAIDTSAATALNLLCSWFCLIDCCIFDLGWSIHTLLLIFTFAQLWRSLRRSSERDWAGNHGSNPFRDGCWWHCPTWAMDRDRRFLLSDDEHLIGESWTQKHVLSHLWMLIHSVFPRQNTHVLESFPNDSKLPFDGPLLTRVQWPTEWQLCYFLIK